MEEDKEAYRLGSIRRMDVHDFYILLIPEELRYFVYEEDVPAGYVYRNQRWFRQELERR